MTEGGGSLGPRLRSPVPLVACAAPHAIPTGPRQVFAHFQTNESKIGDRINKSQGAVKLKDFGLRANLILAMAGVGAGAVGLRCANPTYGICGEAGPLKTKARSGSPIEVRPLTARTKTIWATAGVVAGADQGYAALTRPDGEVGPLKTKDPGSGRMRCGLSSTNCPQS